MWSELAQDTGGIHFSHTVWKRRWNCLDIVLVTIAGADSFPWEGSELYGLGHKMITWSGVRGWKQFLLPRSSWVIKNSLTVWSFITLTCFIVSAFSKKVSFIPSDVCVLRVMSYAPEESTGSLGARVTRSCELSDMRARKQSLGPVQEEYTLLTTEPSLQPLEMLLKEL